MGDGPWFLERSGKFYGPFSLEKVRSLIEAGKIGMETRVAKDKTGQDVMSLSDIPEFASSQPSQDRPAPKPAENKVSPARTPKTDLEVWRLIDGEDRLGPFSLSQLKRQLEAGKVKPGDKVLKDGADHPIELKLLLPTPAPNGGSKPAPGRNSPNAGLHMEKQPQEPGSKGFRKRYMAVIALAVVISVVAVMLWPPRKGGPSMFEKIADQFNKNPEIKKVIRQQKSQEKRTPPPFNQMVQRALSTGLNFTYEEVKKYHAGDQLIYGQQGPREFGALFPGRIAREIHYASDGNLGYTFLLDADQITFAVIIKGPNFGKYLLSDYHISEFSKDALPPLDKPDETVWKVKLVDGVLAKAVWTQQTTEKNARYLAYVCVMNESE